MNEQRAENNIELNLVFSSFYQIQSIDLIRRRINLKRYETHSKEFNRKWFATINNSRRSTHSNKLITYTFTYKLLSEYEVSITAKLWVIVCGTTFTLSRTLLELYVGFLRNDESFVSYRHCSDEKMHFHSDGIVRLGYKINWNLNSIFLAYGFCFSLNFIGIIMKICDGRRIIISKNPNNKPDACFICIFMAFCS